MNTDNAIANATTPGESTTAAATSATTLSNTTTTTAAAVATSNGYDPQQQNRHSPLQQQQQQQTQLNEVNFLNNFLSFIHFCLFFNCIFICQIIINDFITTNDHNSNKPLNILT